MRIPTLCLAVSFVLLCGCVGQRGARAPGSLGEPRVVSLIQLIANPKDYHGQLVRVFGFVTLDFEGTAIYLHQDDYKYGLDKNGLWIDVTREIGKRRADYDQKYVLVEGIFDGNERGHMGLFSGCIRNISRFQVWSDKDGRH